MGIEILATDEKLFCLTSYCNLKPAYSDNTNCPSLGGSPIKLNIPKL